MCVLTDWRTKPAVPFGGKFRITDFTLSNCLHSGINKICVLTQYKSHSLNRHLVKGWGTINNNRGDFLDIIPKGIKRGDHVHAHTFRNPTNDDPPYWRDVGTIASYYTANIE